MKRLNKKGFTLVELLAVIVVLAVVMLLAVNAVIPQMNKARKNAFLTEAQTYFTGAETWYSASLLEGGNAGTCVTFDTLEGDYVNAKDADKLTGYITLEKDADTDGNIYKIYMTDGEYSISGKTPAEVADGTNAIDATTATITVPTTCE